jgi:NADPH:quinone reductase-like Zn-dependent oxidoreductase
MKAIVVTDPTAGTAGMQLEERPDPDAARLASLEGANYGDVVVEVHASGFTGNELEWPSTWIDRLGRDRTPSIPGHEVAGVVTSRSYGATGLSVGQRVFGLTDWTRDGTLAEYTVVEARNLAPLPGDVDFTVGAGVAMTGLTAWQGLFEHGRLQTGQSVLVHGAAGAVGSMATSSHERPAHMSSALGAPPACRRHSTSARTSSSTSTTTPSKTSAESTWCSTSSAATSRNGPRVWFEPEERS